MLTFNAFAVFIIVLTSAIGMVFPPAFAVAIPLGAITVVVNCFYIIILMAKVNRG